MKYLYIRTIFITEEFNYKFLNELPKDEGIKFNKNGMCIYVITTTDEDRYSTLVKWVDLSNYTIGIDKRIDKILIPYYRKEKIKRLFNKKEDI